MSINAPDLVFACLLADKLRELLGIDRYLRITREELAEESGIPKDSWESWLGLASKTKTIPEGEEREKLATYLKMDPSDLDLAIKFALEPDTRFASA